MATDIEIQFDKMQTLGVVVVVVVNLEQTFTYTYITPEALTWFSPISKTLVELGN